VRKRIKLYKKHCTAEDSIKSLKNSSLLLMYRSHSEDMNWSMDNYRRPVESSLGLPWRRRLIYSGE